MYHGTGVIFNQDYNNIIFSLRVGKKNIIFYKIYMKTKLIKIPLPLRILLTAALSLFIACASTAPDKPGFTLTVIHINDAHGRMGAEPFISKMAADLRGQGKNVLILDAGDRLHGQTAANLSGGEAAVSVMNAAGYSAMVPGNHDFNFGVGRLLELSQMMNFGLFAVNVRDLSGKSLFRPDTIFRMDGISVGVFGIATPETKTAADPRIVAGLTFDDPKQAAVNIVDTLKARGCDIIIALTHLGNDVLAAVPGIDVIVDGHSHELFMSGKSVNNVLIGQAGEHGKYIGVIEIAVSGGAVVSKTAKVIAVPGGDGEIDSGGLVPDSAVIAKISEEEAKMEQITSVVIGKTSVLLQGERDSVRTRRTNLTDMVTNSMLHATGADIALLTGGNIRAGIAAGDITMGQVLTVLPFSNLLVTLELSGADILSALEHGVSRYPEPAAQYIHAAGINFEFDPNAEPVKRITKVTMANGKALDASGTYTVATIEFIAAGGDGYNMMSNGKNLVYYGGDAEALARYLGQ